MNLTDVRKARIPRKRKFPVGRGRSSGKGKTSGRGGKGQTARTGVSFRPYFEGGQMPSIRRIPKRGFNNANFRTNYAIINVATLDRCFSEGDLVDSEILLKRGILKRLLDGVKVLGDGEIKKKLTVKAHRFSGGAEKKIVAAGGTVEWLTPRPKTEEGAKTPAAAKAKA